MNIGDGGALASIENLLSAAGAFNIELARARAIVDEVQATVLQHWRRQPPGARPGRAGSGASFAML
jgi:hypothetical protein